MKRLVDVTIRYEVDVPDDAPLDFSLVEAQMRPIVSVQYIRTPAGTLWLYAKKIAAVEAVDGGSLTGVHPNAPLRAIK